MSLRHRASAERGQAIVLVVAVLAVLIGIAALVIDGGSWLRAQRHLQTAADAGALAGAQNLPTDQSARELHRDQLCAAELPGHAGPNRHVPRCRHDRRGRADDGSGISRQDLRRRVQQRHDSRARSGGGQRAGLLEERRAGGGEEHRRVRRDQPGLLRPDGDTRFDESQVASSTIGLIDLTCHSTQSNACGSTAGIGGSQLESWIENGFPDALPANQWYGVKTGETVGPVKHGFEQMVGTPLFFPVFDQVTNTGSQYFFHVIGWAAFVINPGGITWGPQGRQLVGHFTTFIATDLAAGGPIGGSTDFGVHTITLIQ